MNKRIINFFLGLFAVVFLVKLMLIDRGENKENFVELYAKFNKIDGVNIGTSVVVSGIKVGEVKKIFLENNHPNIVMNIDSNVNISKDSSISIQTDGLFGSKFLIIEVGGLDDRMKDGDKFSFSEDSIMVDDLLRKIIEIGETKKGKKL